MERTAEGRPETDSATVGRWRRRLLSLFILVTLGAIASSLIPGTALRGGAQAVTGPYLRITGLDQTWTMFAPNPPQESVDLVARVERADGSVGEYRVPAARGLASLWDYRWRIDADWAANDDLTPDRLALANWFAEKDHAAGATPVRVSLVRLASALPPPGSPDPTPGPWVATTVFVTPVVVP